MEGYRVWPLAEPLEVKAGETVMLPMLPEVGSPVIVHDAAGNLVASSELADVESDPATWPGVIADEDGHVELYPEAGHD